jgi:multidrug efflux pump subunit AcrA (membrane-fusion protein)
MDKPVSPLVQRQRRNRRWLVSGIAGLLLALATLGVARLQPALPRVDKASLYLGTVQRGEMVRQVRGNGTLVPEQILFVQAESEGRIERILVQAGEAVTNDTLLMELSNPQLEQESFDAQWQLKGTESQLTRMRAQLENDRLALKSALSQLKADAAQTEQDARVNEALANEKLISKLESDRTRARADNLKERVQIEEERAGTNDKSAEAQLAAQQGEVERARALSVRKTQQVAALKVRAGVEGVLQQIGDAQLLQVGQRVTPGATLAKIVQPDHLKAVLKVPEMQMRDVLLGQKAEIDTRNGVVPGKIVRIDPAAQNGTVTVDVKLEGPLPKGSRPDLSVDGVIELERLVSVLYVGRPVQGQESSTVGLFKLVDGGRRASRVSVKLGRSSVSHIEVLQGLQPGDQVVLSDMSAWDGYEKVTLE